MPLPAGWTLITVSGTYTNNDGSPANGRVHFLSEQVVVIGGETIVPRKITAVLDATGSFSIELPSTDDPDLDVTGWAYTVREEIKGGRAPYAIFVEYNGGPIDLASVATVQPPEAMTAYVSLTTFNALEARVDVLESAPGGGSGAWGDITGTLADQTDLQAALDAKEAAGAAAAAQAAAATDATTKANAAQAAAIAAAATDATTKANAAQSAAQSYADTLVVGLVDDRGNYDASVNTFPAAGGSGSAGAVKKGDLWTVSVAGTLGGHPVTAGDLVRALVDTPGQTDANWALTENNIGYVAENASNKDIDGTLAANSDTLYPSQKAAKTYADAKYAAAIQRGNHTGTQLASTISDFAATVRGVLLTGLSLATAQTIAATDTVLQALGYLQAQITLALAATTGLAASKFWARAASGAAAAKDITDFGLSLVDDADPRAGRTTLQLRGSMAHRKYNFVVYREFLDTQNNTDTFTGSAISSGTGNSTPTGYPTRNHPGVSVMKSAASANSGFRWQTATSMIVLGGYERFDIIFKTPASLTDPVLRFGFLTSTTSADAADGCYFEVVGGVAVGKCANSSTRTTSSTVHTLGANTWYHCRVDIDSTAASATFTIYDDSGNVVGTQRTVSSNMPTAVLGCGVVATTAGSAAIDLCGLDFISMAVPFYDLVRGAD